MSLRQASAADQHVTPWLDLNEALDICLDDDVVGNLGVLPSALEKGICPEGHVVWFNLSMAAFRTENYPAQAFKPLPVFPGSWQDFTLLAPENRYEDLSKVLSAFSQPVVRSWEYLYAYRGKGVPKGQTSHTVRFWLGLDDRTLAAEDLEDFRSKYLAHLDAAGLSLR